MYQSISIRKKGICFLNNVCLSHEDCVTVDDSESNIQDNV